MDEVITAVKAIVAITSLTISKYATTVTTANEGLTKQSAKDVKELINWFWVLNFAFGGFVDAISNPVVG